MTARAAVCAAVLTVLPVVAPTAAVAQSRPFEPEPIPAGVAPRPGEYPGHVDVLHYEVELGISDQADWFQGRTEILMEVRTAGSEARLDFTGLAVDAVLLNGAPADYDYEDGSLRLILADIPRGDTVAVVVSYQGHPDDALSLGPNVHGAPSAFVDNWPNRTRFWMPSVDQPADKATVSYTLHAPADWVVVANGHLATEPAPTPVGALGPDTGERRTWRWEVGVPISTYNMVFGAADMVVESVGLAACGDAPASRRPDGCVDVTYWVFPEDADYGARVFARAAEMVDFFTDLVGPFPFEKLANVQSATRFGGMENASAIFYSGGGIATGRLGEGTVSHEIAHQWFGDAVTQADWHHVWLSEGFATYFGHLFFEHAEGVQDFRRRMEESRQSYLGSDVVDLPVINHEEDDIFAMLNANSYPKGGWVLHMLRGMLGDEVFFQGIRRYYRLHTNTAVLSEDLQAALESVSGRDLEWFFHQWLHLPGYPVFQVEHEWTPSETGEGGSLEITVRQTQKEAWPRFRVPVEVEITGGVPGTGTLRVPMEIDGAVTTLRVQTDGPPDRIVLDPDGWVLKGGS